MLKATEPARILFFPFISGHFKPCPIILYLTPRREWRSGEPARRHLQIQGWATMAENNRPAVNNALERSFVGAGNAALPGSAEGQLRLNQGRSGLCISTMGVQAAGQDYQLPYCQSEGSDGSRLLKVGNLFGSQDFRSFTSFRMTVFPQ